MRLTKVSVRKYRSIDKQAVFNVEDFTVLVGPNNQGKSNLLRAAVLAMEIIEGWANLPEFVGSETEFPTDLLLRNGRSLTSRRTGVGNQLRKVGYDWEKDFPLYARDRNGSQKSTVVQLDFELSSQEQISFKEETGISINQSLPILVSMKKSTVTLSIPKSGRGPHAEKARTIARFVTERIALIHIPAVRTGSTAIGIAEEILASRRRQLLRSDEYTSVLEKIRKLDETAVMDVAGVLQTTLERFIPGVQSVKLESRSLSRSSGLDDILIDDGVLTPIATKGDGIQSLVALALTMEWTKSSNHPDKQLIIAVEEPESHLHPGAVHELRAVLKSIAESQQVVVTTHSQALINQRSLSRNIIVSERTATPAKNLDDLRNALGVRLSDALSAAEVVVISEGYLDEVLLPVLLVARDPEVGDWLSEGRLIIESAGGGSKIYARTLSARSILTQPIVVLDSDPAGKKDVERLIADDVIDQRSVVQVVRPGCSSSELEDILLLSCYQDELEDEIGFSLKERQLRKLENGRDEAWSERLHSILEDVGVPDPEKLVKAGKYRVVHAAIEAVESGIPVIGPDSEQLLDRLIDLIRGGLS